MENPEKVATLGTQDMGQKETKQKTQHKMYTQTNTNNVNKT
jgi:hypothetical protein